MERASKGGFQAEKIKLNHTSHYLSSSNLSWIPWCHCIHFLTLQMCCLHLEEDTMSGTFQGLKLGWGQAPERDYLCLSQEKLPGYWHFLYFNLLGHRSTPGINNYRGKKKRFPKRKGAILLRKKKVYIYIYTYTHMSIIVCLHNKWKCIMQYIFCSAYYNFYTYISCFSFVRFSNGISQPHTSIT